MDVSSPFMDWSVVSFVEKEELSADYLTKFFTKLNEKLHQRAEIKLLSLNFAESPLLVNHLTSDYYHVRDVLKRLRFDFPSCIVVYCVLPRKDSEEYGWIKQLTNEYGFAKQCILRENVENYFATCSASVNDVCDNIASWFSRKIGELAYGSRYYNPHTLNVTKTNEYFAGEIEPKNSSGDCASFNSYNDNSFKASGGPNELIISGFPFNYSSFQVAGILHEYRVTNVEMSTKENSERIAFVQLGSKFEVLQACKNINEKLINEKFVVKLTPNNPLIVEKFQQLYK